jgi:hypothetical protein
MPKRGKNAYRIVIGNNKGKSNYKGRTREGPSHYSWILYKAKKW